VSYATLFLTFGVGFLLGSFVVGQILICVRFAIPTAAAWCRLGVFRGVSPLRRYQVCAAVLLLAGAGLTLLTLKVFPDDAIVIGAGAVLATLLAIPGSGRTPENLEDFIEGNRDVLDEERLLALGGAPALATVRTRSRRP
jgi:hypothetical protein